MYKMKVDGVVFYDPSSDNPALHVLSPKAKYELNKAGSLEFIMLPGNVAYNSFQKMKSIVTLEQDGEEIFRGRVLEATTDLYNQKSVCCEGELGYLLDSLVRPYKFEGTASDLFRKLVADHNAQVDSHKRFQVGTITAVDSEDEVKTESEAYMSTLNEIKQMLIGPFGGYLRVRYSGSTKYLDYIKDYTGSSGQPIEFGVNLVDIEDTLDASDVFSVLVPLGGYYGRKHAAAEKKAQEEAEKEESGETEGDGTVTASETTDGETTEGETEEDPVAEKLTSAITIESVNGGLDYIVDSAALAKYGRIVKSYKWEELDDPQEIMDKGWEHFEKMKEVRTLTLKAVDLHVINKSVDSIRFGDNVRLTSSPHGLSMTDVCSKLELEIECPDQSEYTFGIPPESLTGNNANNARNNKYDSSHLHKWIRETEDTLYLAAENIEITAENLAMFVEQMTAEIGRLNAKIDQLVLDIGDAEITIERLQALLDEADVKIGELTAEIENADVKIGELKAEIDDADIKIGNLKAEIENADISIEKLKAEIGKADIKIDDLKAEIDNADIKINNLKAEIGNADIKIGNLKAEIESADVKIGELTAEIGNADVKIGELTAEIGKADVAIGELNAEIGKADIKIGELTAEIGNADVKIDDLTAEIGNADLKITNLTAEIENADLKIDEMNLIAEEVNVKADEINTQAETIKTQADRVELIAGDVDYFVEQLDLKADKATVEANYVTIDAFETTITGLVKMEDFETVQGWATDFSGVTVSASNVVAGSGDFDELSCGQFWCGSLYVDGETISSATLTMGTVSETIFGPSDINLAHSHKIVDNGDGTFSLGEVSSTGGSFNIAATSYYKNGVAAAKESVTLTASGWQSGRNTVTASNGKSVAISLPSFSTSGGTTWNASNQTTVYFYTGSVSGPLASKTVDASSIYTKGADSVTLSAGEWASNKMTVTASNGVTLEVDASSIYQSGAEFGMNYGYEFAIKNARLTLEGSIVTCEDASGNYTGPTLDISSNLTASYNSGYSDATPVHASHVASYNAADNEYALQVTVLSDDGTRHVFDMTEIDASAAYDAGYAAAVNSATITCEGTKAIVTFSDGSTKELDLTEYVKVTGEIRSITNTAANYMQAQGWANALINDIQVDYTTFSKSQYFSGLGQ